MGHVNNAVYFSYFEWARTKYWLEMVRSQDPHDIAFIVARAECDFRQQLGLAEQIRIGVRIGDMRTSSFDFMYEIRRENGEIAATAKVIVVHFSWATNSKQPISDELRRTIKTFQGEND